MEVKLLTYTQHPQRVIYAAAKQCYSKKDAAAIFESSQRESEAAISTFVKGIMARGHMSPLEHVSFTFAVNGISRACSHQLVRHRIASYSQQSQRYVDMESFEYVIPPLIAADAGLKQKYIEAIEAIRKSYTQMKNVLQAHKDLDREAINQDLRFILPNAATTKIVVTMNCRELLHFFSERLCARAQWEIRAMAEEMCRCVQKVLPEIFSEAGAKCVSYEYCPEGDKGCGRYPGR